MSAVRVLKPRASNSAMARRSSVWGFRSFEEPVGTLVGNNPPLEINCSGELPLGLAGMDRDSQTMYQAIYRDSSIDRETRMEWR